MKLIKLDTRYWLVRHWFRWYLVRSPQRGKFLWKPLDKSVKTIDE